MTSKERDIIDKLIHELDTAVGMLVVSAMKDMQVSTAMREISKVSFELTNLL